MISDEAENIVNKKNHLWLQDLIGQEKHFRKWVEHPSSTLLHHDSSCCEEARLWFLAYAHSMEIWSLSQFKMKAPTWLSQHFSWGPTRWPISWCDLVKEKTIDCGVFAALSREIFKAQGIEAHPAQGLLKYNDPCTRHWKDLWRTGLEKKETKDREGEIFPWVGSKIVYHEFCIVESPDNQVLAFDSTWGNWYEPHQHSGFGSLLALKTDCPRLLQWHEKTLSCGEWIDL